MATRRQALFHLLAMALVVLAVLLGPELLVRIAIDDGLQFDLEMWKYARDVKVAATDPLISHFHAPNRQRQLMGVELKTNSKGLRDREIPYERSPGTLRALMLGDSFTLGWGVPFEQTFAKRIERMFARRGVAAEVINAGIGNYNTVMEVEYFLTSTYKFDPDIIVLNFFVNDAEPIPTSRGIGPLLRVCHACVFTLGRIDTLLRLFSARKGWTEYYRDLYGNGEAAGWQAAKAHIAKLAAYAREHHKRLLIASLPELHDLEHYRFQRVTDLVREAAEENGAAFVDLLPDLRRAASADLWVTPSDQHPNALAHGLIAEGLFRKLDAMRRGGD
ncbi:MAG: SGNH/GDSL hydrolase family protein [Hyphomicrobiales bacterium]|nr:SGNH/GDSL hydrolase family protein [Hyphomicrobiales bacterium]